MNWIGGIFTEKNVFTITPYIITKRPITTIQVTYELVKPYAMSLR